jgi:hypothetical protein
MRKLIEKTKTAAVVICPREVLKRKIGKIIISSQKQQN